MSTRALRVYVKAALLVTRGSWKQRPRPAAAERETSGGILPNVVPESVLMRFGETGGSRPCRLGRTRLNGLCAQTTRSSVQRTQHSQQAPGTRSHGKAAGLGFVHKTPATILRTSHEHVRHKFQSLELGI